VSYEPVDVYLKDQQGNPISDTVVRVFNPAGTVFFTQQTTDVDGKASFLLFTQDYSMRFYKFRATFPQPQMFTVLTAPNLNTFDVKGEVFYPPVANDPRLCRCAGYFRDPDGTSQQFLDLHFYPEFSPIIVDQAGVMPRKSVIRTDEQGYAEIDLFRGGCYRVTIEGQDNEERYVRVPDLASCNLPDLLFAVVKRITFDPPGPWTIAAGAELEVTPTVYDSAGAVLTGTGQNDVDWTSSATSVLGLQVKETTIVLRALEAGSAELRAARRDQSIIRIPNVAVDGQPVAVTVSAPTP
jgi:hypothetical protein